MSEEEISYRFRDYSVGIDTSRYTEHTCMTIIENQTLDKKEVLAMQFYDEQAKAIQNIINQLLQENKELKEDIYRLKDINQTLNMKILFSKTHYGITKQEKKENSLLKTEIKGYTALTDILNQRIDKAIEYIKENTRYYDSEYSKIYGCLCDMAGARDIRTHVILGDEELLKILEGDK